MNTALWIMLAAAGASSPSTMLYCVGDAWLKVGDPAEDSRVLKLDIARGKAEIGTFSGAATGSIQATEQHYKGTLRSTGGKSFSFTVDRFSGEFSLMIPAESRLEFLGTCQLRAQKF